MDATEATPIPASLGTRIGRKVGLAWLALAWEGVWPRLMPLLAMSRCSSPRPISTCSAALDPWVPYRPAGRSGAGLRRRGVVALPPLRLAVRAEAIRRLEQDSGVPHRPLVAVQDTLAAAARTAWSRRCGRRIAAARPSGWPASATSPPIPASPSSTPGRCARAGAGADRRHRRGRRLARRPHGRAVTPAFPPPPPVVANLWIAPPAYTGKAPIYLDMADRDKLLRVPVGSKLAGFLDDVRGRNAAQAGDRRQGDRVQHRLAGQVPGRGGDHPGQQDRPDGARATSRRAGSCTSFPISRRPSSSPARSASTNGRPRSSTSAGDDFGITGRAAADPPARLGAGREMLDDSEEPEVLRVDLPVPGGSKKIADTSCATSPAIRGLA
jgi:hypothetical protein